MVFMICVERGDGMGRERGGGGRTASLALEKVHCLKMNSHFYGNRKMCFSIEIIVDFHRNTDYS